MTERTIQVALAAILGFTAAVGALQYSEAHAEDPVPTSTCPHQRCEWKSGSDMDGQYHYWQCVTPGGDTNRKCTWRLGDCYQVPCNTQSPGYSDGLPNQYTGG